LSKGSGDDFARVEKYDADIADARQKMKDG
jgi:hypothetical protein